MGVVLFGERHSFLRETMRYLTKEWYLGYVLTEWITTLRVVQNTEFFSEKYFQSKYEVKEKKFINNSKIAAGFIDCRETSDKPEKIIFNPKISNEERQHWNDFKNSYIHLYNKNASLAEQTSFDEDKTKLTFANRHRNILKLVNRLPQEILEQVPDKRMLALGYTSRKIKDQILAFAEKQKEWVKLLQDQAVNANAIAEKYRSDDPFVSRYCNGMIKGLIQFENDLIIVFIDETALEIKRGKIIFQEEPIYTWNVEDEYAPASKMVGAEIEYIDGKFKLNLLIENDSGCENMSLAEVAIECDGVYWIEK